MINLYVNYYKDTSFDRQKELDICLQKNICNPLINVLVLESQSKMKYSDFFNIINTYTGPDDINAICNSDIYLDDTISVVNGMDSKEAFALCRWDLAQNGTIKFNSRPDSQDTWIFKGKILNVFGDFCLGFPGCDNRIAYEMQKAGYRVSNPAKTIRTIHVHLSNVRNYSVKGKQRAEATIPGPYKTMGPTTWEQR